MMDANTTTRAEEGDETIIFENPRVRLMLILAYTVVFIFCFLGNLTVVLVVTLQWRMRTLPKFCLGNLAFANLCVSIFCVYQNLSLFLIESWIFGSFLCKVCHFMNSLAHTASILILVVISVERYLVVLHPLKCRSMLTIRRLRLIILGVWIASGLISSPRLYFVITTQNPMKIKGGEDEIICGPGSSLIYSRVADGMNFSVLFFIPLVVICILYTKIVLYIRSNDRFRKSFVTNSSVNNSKPDCNEDILNINNVTPKNFAEGGSTEKELHPANPADTLRSIHFVGGASIPHGANHGVGLQSNAPRHNREIHAARFATTATKNDLKDSRVKNAILPSGSVIPSGAPQINQRKHSRIKTSQRPETSSVMTVERRRSNSGTVKMLTTIVCTFAACNLPFHLKKLYQHYVPESEVESDLTELATPLTCLLMYANCAINPILFAFMSKSFRRSTIDCFRCRFRKKPRTAPKTSTR